MYVCTMHCRNFRLVDLLDELDPIRTKNVGFHFVISTAREEGMGAALGGFSRPWRVIAKDLH